MREEQQPIRESNNPTSGTYGSLTIGTDDLDLAEKITSKNLSPDVALAGLSSAEAKRRLAYFGPNELDDVPKKSFLHILLLQLMNLIFLLTGTAAIICYATGDATKGTFLLCLVAGVCTLNALGEYSTQDAGAALKAMGGKAAVVKRDGQFTEVPVGDVAPGDVVKVGIGDVIPADMEILECIDIQCNESTLTGEAKEVSKTLEAAESETAFPTNMLYKSTSCVSGSGLGFVTATGMYTQVGLIAKRLKDDVKPDADRADKEGGGPGGTGDKEEKDKKKSEINPIQRSINKLGQLITMGCFIYISCGTITSFMMRYQNLPPDCDRGDTACILEQAIVRGLLMAVALIPHGLPLVVMIMLRIAAHEMKERSAVVTRMSAVDYLGATNVICTDKTGTLTEGRMAARTFVGMHREASAASPIVSVRFHPLRGLNPQGGCFASSDITEAKLHELDHMAATERTVPGLQNIADPREKISGPNMPVALISQVGLAAASLGCYSVSIGQKPDGGWEAKGNMSEAALKVATYKGFLEDGSPEANKLFARHERVPELEVSFSSSRKMSVTVHKVPDDKRFQTLSLGKDVTHIAILKGAPDRLVPSLKTVFAVDKDGLLRIADSPMTSAERQQVEGQNTALAQQALRSLLISLRPLTARDVDQMTRASDADGRLAFLKAQGPLTFVGIFGIYDPPRESVPPSIKECHEAGVRVVMITGDQRDTALAIGKVVGIIEEGADDTKVARMCADLHEEVAIARSPDRRLSTQKSFTLSTHDKKRKQDAHEVEFKSTEEVAEMTGEVCAWSRALPSDKVTIVESLGLQGFITSMTGDGVNDAPALKRADVGVSMGITGTEVTKNAASLVLMDDNFSTIVAAVAEGRRIYGNVQKYVVYNLSVKLSECTAMLVAIFCGLPMPIQGLPQLVNLLATHIIPPIALAWETPESYNMRVPPRKTGADLIITRAHLLYRIIPFFITFSMLVIGLLTMFTWMEVGYTHVHSIIGSTEAGAIRRGVAACEFAGSLNSDGMFRRDNRPYHCKCDVRHWPFDSSPEEVEQWGILNVDDIEIDRHDGSTGDHLKFENTPWAGGGLSDMLEICADDHGEHMCWKDPYIDKPLLSKSKNCASWGAKLATTQSYASIAMGEIAALATHRTECFYGLADTNRAYVGVLIFNLCVLALVLYWGWLNELLDLAPLTPHRLVYCFICPVVVLVAAELIKMVYRPMRRQEHDRLWEEHRNQPSGKQNLQLAQGTAELPDGKV